MNHRPLQRALAARCAAAAGAVALVGLLLMLGACRDERSGPNAAAAASGNAHPAQASGGSEGQPTAGPLGSGAEDSDAAGASGVEPGTPASGNGASAGSGPTAGNTASANQSGGNSGDQGASGSAAMSGAARTGLPTAGNNGSGTPSTTAALGPDCDRDPLADQQPYGSGFYQKFHGLFGCAPAADLALYRRMLPDKFAMPADPQVCFYTIDFEISGVGPYHEAAILLPVTYKGESGKYVLSMDLDNLAATAGGRALGFPKYMGEVSLDQQGNDWTATARANGTVDLKATYTGQCTESDEFLWPDFINLTPIPLGTTSSQAFLPPRSGRALKIPAEYLSKAVRSLKGTIRLEFGDHLPWNGLVDESKPFPGLWSAFVGGVDLGNQPLD